MNLSSRAVLNSRTTDETAAKMHAAIIVAQHTTHQVKLDCGEDM
jgi:hypothetical protein